jgi:hypothetical protein
MGNHWMFGAVVSVLLLAGCDITYRGCTDPQAVNYDAIAEEDDGTCTYAGSAVFWYNATTAEELQFYESNELTLYIDNQLISTMPTTNYWLVAPDCASAGAWVWSRDLGTSDSAVATYRIEDNFGDVLWDGVVAINQNGCTAIALTL